MLAVLEHADAVYEDVPHADGVLMGLLVGGPVRDGGGIEDDDVGEIAFLQQAAMVEPQICRGQVAELADRRFEGQEFFFADIFAE